MEIQHKGWNWDQVSSEYWTQISREFFPTALDWSRRFHSILDIGAGKGRHSFFFADHGLEVSAIDLSEESIRYIRQEAQNRGVTVNAELADMTDLPFADNSFDCVICFHTIYHSDYQGTKRALQEVKRVLKPGGEAYFTFNTKENPHYNKEKSVDGYTMIPQEGFEAGIPHCYLDENDLLTVLSDFVIISMDKITNYIHEERETHGIHFFVHVKRTDQE